MVRDLTDLLWTVIIYRSPIDHRSSHQVSDPDPPDQSLHQPTSLNDCNEQTSYTEIVKLINPPVVPVLFEHTTEGLPRVLILPLHGDPDVMGNIV